MLNTHGCLSNERDVYLFLPEKLGVEVNSIGSCAICRAQPHPVLQTIITDPSSLDLYLDRTHPSGRCHMQAVARDLYEDLDHTRSFPRPLTYRRHSYGRVHMYFANVSTRKLFSKIVVCLKRPKETARSQFRPTSLEVWTNTSYQVILCCPDFLHYTHRSLF